MCKKNLGITDVAPIEWMASYYGYSVEEARAMWENNQLAAPIGAVKTQCTGRNTHKPAFLGWVRVSMSKGGEYAIGMGEGGQAKNYQNGRNLGGHTKRQGAFWPLPPDDLDGEPSHVSHHSYRFFCDRCSRDFLISRDKLGQAAQAMIVNRRKYLDLSLLPFG